jgi:hypothetical protein
MRRYRQGPADPAASGLPPTDSEHLPDDVATLKRMVLELLASLQERDRDDTPSTPHALLRTDVKGHEPFRG